jgi:MFS family permease
MKPLSATVKWIIVAMAALGFLFDIYEVLVAPLTIQPALLELGNLSPGTPEYRDWASYLFWFPPLVGGFCGLWGGYFADRFGRRRILTWSILLYTVAAFAAGMVVTLPQLLACRILAFAGVCVEFVAAIAWLSEIFTEPRSREAVIGYTQAFSSLGGVVVAAAFYLANRFGPMLPAIHGGHSAWRYALMFGLAPALPLAVIRPWLPESPEWSAKRESGLLKRPSIAELFDPRFRQTTIVVFLLFACGYGIAYATIQQSPQIAPGLPEVASLAPTLRGQATASVQASQEFGGLLGRVLIAGLGLVIVSRRKLIRLFLIPGLALTPVVFLYTSTADLATFRAGIFIAGITTVAHLNFLGNYLPRVYPVYLRGTGEGFAANVGGRMVGTSASWIVTHLSAVMPGSSPGMKLAYAAALIGVVLYSTALMLTCWLPEPPEKLE